MHIGIVSFYSFVNINNPEDLIPKILFYANRKNIKGTVLLACEGFNGSISGNQDDLMELVNQIKKETNSNDVSVKINYADKHPFQKIKVKLKKEIVSLKVGEIDVENLKGDYIDSQDWDAFIAQEDVILIDTRNQYETEVGTFRGAVAPNTETFREFPQWAEKNKELFEGKKIAMCCTGGIRCEKSTAYMKSLGYKDVYHLKGGILQYLEDTKNSNQYWQGECFVFDDRRAVQEDLGPAVGYWLER